MRTKTNEDIFDATPNLYEFWQAGGTWSMNHYIKHLIEWEKKHPEVYAEVSL